MAILENTGRSDVRKAELTAAGGSLVELVAGVGAIILPILGLVGVLPFTFAAISFLAVGSAMMIRGAALTSQSRTLLFGTGEMETVAWTGGVTSEMLGGAAVSALGVLALLRIAPMTLLAVAAIVAGASIVIGAGTMARLSTYRYGLAHVDDRTREVLRNAVNAAAGADVLVGLGSIVLGSLVAGNVGARSTHTTLVLISALGLGSALFLNGTAVGARMGALLKRK